MLGATGGESLAGPWRVRIQYREPTFEARIGRVGPPYEWTYEVSAPDSESAIGAALRRFTTVAEASQVRWVREVVGVQVLGPGR